MKKWNLMLLALLLLSVPAAGSAQNLPELFTGVYESIGEGLAQGVQLAAMNQELTLDMQLSSGRLEEGKRVALTITAGNPLPYDAQVDFAVKLPKRLKADGETTWSAVLPSASVDAKTGNLAPSETMFTLDLSLEPDGESEEIMLECEMSMGTRFYRAHAPLALCVPHVSVSAQLDGEARLLPGDVFAYRVEVVNSGDAPKDVNLDVTLPEAVTLSAPLPEGFVQTDNVIRGQVHAPAAQNTASGMTPACREIVLHAVVAEDALDGDSDAQRLLAGTLRADGERVAMPRIQVCGPKISARLMSERESLEAGEETTLSIVVVNSGLADADVQISCMLPKGLALARQTATDGEADEKAVPLPGDDDLPGAGAVIPVETDVLPAMTGENRTLVYNLHVKAAEETKEGVIARTQVIEIPVRALMDQKSSPEQLLGASVAWCVSGEEAQLGEAVALRVHGKEVLGLSKADWNGVFWTGILLLAAVLCLYAAMHRGHREEDYCFE